MRRSLDKCRNHRFPGQVNPSMITIETERLVLRPFSMADVEPSFQMNRDPAVSQYTMDGGVCSRKEIEFRIRNHVMGDYEKHGFGRFAVIDRKTRTFIGFAGLKYLDTYREVDLGYRLLRAYWGQGLATEASRASLDFGFHHLGLNRIIAMAHRDNSASIRVLQKLGFGIEAQWCEDGHPIVRFGLHRDQTK